MPCTKPRWTGSLRLQLLLTYGAALLLTAALLAAAFFIVMSWNEDSVTRKGLMQQVRWIEESLRYDAQGRPVALAADRNSPWVYQSASSDLKYRVLDSRGATLLSSEADSRPLTPAGEAFDPDRQMFEVRSGELRLDAVTVPLDHLGTRYYVQTARSERLAALVRRVIGEPILKTAVWMAVTSLLIFAVAMMITLSRTLRPLRAASAAAARIEPHRLSTRLSSRELPTELTPLIEAFNHALDRLEKGYRVQQEFLTGAAHELKTPLALIRGQIEMDGVADRATLLKDVDLMARQVHQLLHLAEVSEAQNYVIEPTDLAGVGSDAADYLARLAERRQIALNVLSPPLGAMLDADRSAAFVLMKNLLENAIQHSPAGGVVTLHIDDQGLRVRDEGAGIAAEDFSQLFVRFWRGAGRRDEGAGLGLAICQQIAMAHGWHLSARNAGPGAEFNLVFKPA